jgi:FlaG/FlaF family flagellin (archaellin)
VQLKSSATSTTGAFATSGTNQKFLQSTTPGTQATLTQASGTVNAAYLTIRDINATGGATWLAYTDQGNTDAGNVDGWDFGISPVVGGAEYTYTLRSFTQPRRF